MVCKCLLSCVGSLMFLLRAVLNILVRNVSPRGPMCFRCLIFSVCGGALLDRPCMVFQRVCDPNERLSAPSICFVCVFVCWISSFRSLRAGSQVFALLMLFL